MVRQARQRCESDVYHVVLRGVNRGNIFFDKEDHQRFLKTLEQKTRYQEYELYGYCLMSNHVHLLVKEKEDTTIKASEGVTLRQIARVTGLNAMSIHRA